MYTEPNRDLRRARLLRRALRPLPRRVRARRRRHGHRRPGAGAPHHGVSDAQQRRGVGSRVRAALAARERADSRARRARLLAARAQRRREPRDLVAAAGVVGVGHREPHGGVEADRARRDPRGGRALRSERPARGGGGVRRHRDPRGARLSHPRVPLARAQPAHRRVRRLARQPHPFRRRGARIGLGGRRWLGRRRRRARRRRGSRATVTASGPTTARRSRPGSRAPGSSTS